MITRLFTWLFPQPKKPVRKKPHLGETYNLKDLFDSVNADYFENKLRLPIFWSGDKLAKPKTKIRLGSYHIKQQEIRIHRILDHPDIPSYFIRFIIYHEMLHHVHPPLIRKSGRRAIHHAQFLHHEKQFKEYDQVQTYLKDWKKKAFKSLS